MADKTLVLCKKGSSFIDSMTYSTGRLTVKFQGNENTRYHYFFVPYNVFMKVATSESVGAAFNSEIKGVYPTKKVTRKATTA